MNYLVQEASTGLRCLLPLLVLLPKDLQMFRLMIMVALCFTVGLKPYGGVAVLKTGCCMCKWAHKFGLIFKFVTLLHFSNSH